MPWPIRPWGADTRDEEGYTVIRGIDFRPLAYIERSLHKDDEAALALLFCRSPELYGLVREVFYANAHEWSSHDWRKWREKVEVTIAGLRV